MNHNALDFRHFVDYLRRQGDLADVHTEVGINLEIGAITRRAYKRRAPAPLFHNIRNSLPDARIPGAPTSLRADGAHARSRLTLHFGCQNTTGHRVSWPRCAPRYARNRSRHAGWNADRCRRTFDSTSRWI